MTNPTERPEEPRVLRIAGLEIRVRVTEAMPPDKMLAISVIDKDTPHEHLSVAMLKDIRP